MAEDSAKSSGYLIISCVDIVTPEGTSSLDGSFYANFAVVAEKSSLQSPIPSTSEKHILLTLPVESGVIQLVVRNEANIAIGSSQIPFPYGLVDSDTVDCWIPLNNSEFRFPKRNTSTPDQNCPSIRVHCKYVPSSVASKESEVDRIFRCQDFLILALQSLSFDSQHLGHSNSHGHLDVSLASPIGSKNNTDTTKTSTTTLEDSDKNTTKNSASGSASSSSFTQQILNEAKKEQTPNKSTKARASAGNIVSTLTNGVGRRRTRGKDGLPTHNYSPLKRAGGASASGTALGGTDSGHTITKSASSGKVGIACSTKSAGDRPALLGGKRIVPRSSDSTTSNGSRIGKRGMHEPLPNGVSTSNGGVHFKSREDFEDACWQRVKPYHQIIEVLEAKLESSQHDSGDIESYRSAVEISRGQHQELMTKYNLAVDNFEKRIAEITEILDLRNREVSELRGHVNELRLSRDSALDELALGKNKEAIEASQERDTSALATQNRVLSEALQESREYIETDQKRRTEEKRRYRENETKWTKQIDGLSEQLLQAVEEKALVNKTMQDNLTSLQKERDAQKGWATQKVDLEASVKQLEKELRELRSKNQMFGEQKQLMERQQEQLDNRQAQLEEMRATFEGQISREVETQQRMMKEKQELQTEIRELHKKIGHETDNWKSEERDRKLCQAKILELEHKLVLHGDAEKQVKQTTEVAAARENRLQEWASQFEEQQKKFEEHVQSERERVVLLEKDNIDLKKLLQEIQPEFHKLQTELEKAQFKVKETEFRESAMEDERKLVRTLREEMADLEKELAQMKRSKEELQNNVVNTNVRMWDEYILKEEVDARAQPLHSLLQGDSGNSFREGSDRKAIPHAYRYSAVKNDSIDKALADAINSHKPPVPFYRLSQGIYLYGSKKILVKLSKQNKLIFRVGGGYCSFEEFISQFSHEELAKLNSGH